MPTTAEINATIISQLEASLSQTIPLLPKAFNRILAKVLAGVFILVYKYAGSIALQTFVSKATIEEIEILGQRVSPLIEWGRLFGAGDPKSGDDAEYTIDIAVTNQTGSLPSGTQLTSNINGVIYLTKEAVALDAATVSATVQAATTGTAGNLAVGVILTFVNPVANVDRNAEITAETVTGADGETTEAYRQRVVDRVQKQAQGGAAADYEFWGEEASGILNVYPYTGDPGIVDIYVESTTGIPTPAQLTAVEALINFDEDGRATRRPVGTFVRVLPITITTMDVTIGGLVVSDEVAVKADILEALTQFFADRAPFVDGLTIPPRTDFITTNHITGIVNDFVSAKNGFFTSASFMVSGGVAIPIYSLDQGEKTALGNITYV